MCAINATVINSKLCLFYFLHAKFNFLWEPKLLHMEKQLYVQSQAKGEFIATLFWCLIRQVRSFVVQSLDETFRQPKIPSLIVELNFGFLSVVCILNYYKIIAFVLKRRSFPILLLQAESEGNFSVYLYGHNLSLTAILL